MVFHLIYTVLFSFFVSSLLISYDLLIKNFKLIQMHRNFKIIMSILLFISQVYFIVSFSLNSIGYVVFEYTISLFIYHFGVSKKKILLIFLTQLITLTFFMLLNFKDLKSISYIVILNIIIIIFSKTIKKLSLIERFRHSVFYVFFAITNIASLVITSKIFFRREITFFDLFAVVIGSFIVIYLWTYYIENQKKFLDTIDRKIIERDYDELTKLKNYRSLLEDLSTMDINKSLIIVILDLDHFKKINDSYGHGVGNMVLEYFSDNLLIFFENKIDHSKFDIYRYGGEEFLITFNTNNLTLIETLLYEFQKNINQYSLYINKTDQLTIHFSAGISRLNTAQDYLKAINEADRALYHAKENGRNRIITYNFKD